MSLLWRDEVTVLLSPQRVLIRRIPRGLGRPALTQVLSCTPGEAGAWDPALAALAQAANGAWRGAHATIVLSNHFVRYAVVPACPELNSEEYLEFSRHQFARTFGATAAEWVLRINPASNDAPHLASAVAPALLHALAETTQAAGMRLASVQPYLMAVYNECRRTIGSGVAWLALAEPGRLVLALRDGERWLGTWAARTGPVWGADLVALLDRARFLIDGPVEARTVWLHAPLLPDAAFPPRPWIMRKLAPWPLGETAAEKADAPAAS